MKAHGISRRFFLKAAAASTVASGIMKAGIAKAFPPDVISDKFTRMCYHENPVGPHPAVYESIEEIISSGNTINSMPEDGHEILKKRILEYNGVDKSLGTQNIGLTVGSTEALMICAYALLDSESSVLTEWPTYLIFHTRVEQMGSGIIRVPLVPQPDGRLLPDLETMKDLLLKDASIRIVHFNVINNPTGSFMSKGDFDGFVSFCALNRPDVVIIADDSDPEFRERIPGGIFPKPLEHVIAGKSVVHVQTFSHIFGITGLRLGYYIAPAAIASKLEERRIYRGVSTPAVAGGLASLENAAEQIDRSYYNNHEGRLWLYSQFEHMGLDYLKSHGAYVMVNTQIEASIVYILMAAQGVMIRQGSEWGMNTWIRVNPGIHPIENEIFIRAFKNASRKSGASSLKDILNTHEGIQGLKNGFLAGMLPSMEGFTGDEKLAVLKKLGI